MPDGVTAGPPLRILITTDTVGGVWRWSLDLADALAPRGVETVLAVIGPSPFGPRCREAEAIPGLRLVEIGGALDWLAPSAAPVRETAARVAALAVAERVDVVLLSTPALAALARFAVPVIAINHSCLATWWQAVKGDEPVPDDFRWRIAMNHAGLVSAEAVLTPSRAFAVATKRAYDLPKLPLAVLNGRVPPAVAEDRRGRFVFAAGRFWDEAKGLAVLDAAAADMDAPVIAAGPMLGPDGTRAEARHLRSIGVQAEPAMRRWLGRAPVFVSPATYEPFGLGVLEAAQAGAALVLSDIATFRELWDETALFVPTGDSAAIAVAVNALLDDPVRATRLGAVARRRAGRYTAEVMADRMLAVLTAAVRSRRNFVAARAGLTAARARSGAPAPTVPPAPEPIEEPA